MTITSPSRPMRSTRALVQSLEHSRRSSRTGSHNDDLYVAAPTAHGWTARHVDAELLVIVNGEVGETPRFELSADAAARTWRTEFRSRAEVLSVVESLRSSQRVREDQLDLARRVTASVPRHGTQTDLQRALERAGLARYVTASATRTLRSALEHALLMAASSKLDHASLAMGSALGAAFDGLAARDGQIWPDDRWRLERLSCASRSLGLAGTTLDEATSLLLFRRCAGSATDTWFGRASALAHRSLVILEEHDG
ncbi:hypothetical protein JOE58_000355 [Curtobacterium luteum]|uniref:Uncharacterized protein n=2 Tax=Curtobacterium TaxID=2034 RepID=A0A8H9L0E8_9MICO|nr:hypothetical protein [Curtobacterium luteum]MBM7801104.1 hypothetical protein [Curtobacterium luteum]NUU52471.1 hypothetical protein [Curtobacterium luteum]GGK96812.1 hypothetical protein GCM10009769_13690 [Curtobacterium luteum]